MTLDEIFDLELYVFSGPGNGCDEAAIVITMVQKGPASFELHLWQKEMSDEYDSASLPASGSPRSSSEYTQTDILQLTDNQWGYLHGRAEAWYAELFSAPTRRG